MCAVFLPVAAVCRCAESFSERRVSLLRGAVRGTFFKPSLPAQLVENSDTCKVGTVSWWSMHVCLLKVGRCPACAWCIGVGAPGSCVSRMHAVLWSNTMCASKGICAVAPPPAPPRPSRGELAPLPPLFSWARGVFTAVSPLPFQPLYHNPTNVAGLGAPILSLFAFTTGGC
jgi:hypothetical protein